MVYDVLEEAEGGERPPPKSTSGLLNRRRRRDLRALAPFRAASGAFEAVWHGSTTEVKQHMRASLERAATRPKNMQVDAFPAIKSIPSFTQVGTPGSILHSRRASSARLRMEVRKASDRPSRRR